jgi:hypothetical protein
MKNKVIIVSPYFGRLPPWYGLFMLTLERNPDFTWLLVTDARIPARRPSNLLAQSMSLAEFNALCQKKLGFDPAITQGYKICELKPAYGRIFEDFIGGYTHWGYGDCDLLFGNLAAFFPDALLDAYDAFSSCRCTITGQFTLFRNEGRFRDPSQYIPNYAERVRLDGVQHLDEEIMDEALAAQGCRILRRQLQIHDAASDEWRQWAEKLERAETGTLDGLFWKEGDSFWQAGRLLHAVSGKEAMFFHFHHWKHQWDSLRYPYWPGAISRIDIRPNGLKIQFQKPFYSLCFDIGYRFPHWVGGRIAPFFRLAGRIKRGLARRLFPSNL